MRIFILPLLFLLSVPALFAGEPDSSYKLIAVEDGDTIIVQIGAKEIRLQLSGIDAPEDVINPKFTKDSGRTGLTKETLLALGKAATDHLKQLIHPGDQLRIVGDLNNSDKYGRVPVVAFKEGPLSLNERMVADGYAVVLSRAALEASFKQQLQQLQIQAQEQQLGLWGLHSHSTMLWSDQTATH